MNAMTQALVAAGVKTPTQMQILWTIVRDYPGKPAKFIIDTAKLPEASAHAALNVMVHRKMLRFELVPMRVKAGNTFSERGVRHYYTAIREFELLPPVKKVNRSAPTKPAPAPIPAPLIAAPTPVGIDLDNLTIAQARVVYRQLKEMFA